MDQRRGGPRTHRILPDACVDIVSVNGRLIVAGPATRAHCSTTRRAAAFGVRFRVGAAGAALGLPAAELLDASVPLEDVWGAAEARRIAERATNVHELAAGGQRRDAVRADPLVRAAATGTPRQALGIGDRQLRRRFADAVGYGPKTLERILRFQRFLTPRDPRGRPRAAGARRRLRRPGAPHARVHAARRAAPGAAAGRGRRARRREVRFVQDGARRTGHDGRMTVDLNAAATFLHANARVLERRRFEHLFEGGPKEPVLDALRAYRNDDGGFGHAIEPDMRAPTSQPVGVHTVMEILHEVGAHDDPMIGPAADWLATITREDGGIPFVLEDAMAHPHAPWWSYSDDSSVTQTAANAAALHNLNVSHPWLGKADEFLFARIAELDASRLGEDVGLGYDLLFSFHFLDAHPDAARAEAALDAFGPIPEADPGSELPSPLDLSPIPGSRSRRLFDEADDRAPPGRARGRSAGRRRLDRLVAGLERGGRGRVARRRHGAAR